MISRDKAIKIYFSRLNPSERLIKKIMSWDEGATVTENSRVLGIPSAGGYVFAKRFGLNFRKGEQGRPPGSQPLSKASKDVEKIVSLRNKGLTFKEIGERYSLSRQRIEQIVRYYASN